MIQVIHKENCCGCNGCVQACPVRCISMKTDEEGFSYPVVDRGRCTECGLCERVCPVLNQRQPRTPLVCYAAKNPDEEIRMKSSSGGIFTMLAEQTINNGGVVFGARFDENWDVIHDYAETIEGLEKFRGSKYVQSRIGDCFKKAKQFLDAGREVLFSGTPCQIAGLKLFLRKNSANLLAVDIICHGVQSPMVWQKYLKEMNPEQLVLSEISFRDKSSGWKTFSFHAKGVKKDNTIATVTKGTLFQDTYLRVFLKNICLRPSCYECPARSGKGNSDITIADFWGIQNVDAEFDDDKGVSMILPYTEKGLDIVNSVNMVKKEKSIDVDPRVNPNLHLDCSVPKYRKYFFKNIRRKMRTHTQLHDSLRSVLRKESPSRLRIYASRCKQMLKRVIK